VSGEVVEDGPELLIPDARGDGRPCRHLAFLSVGLEAFDPDDRRDNRRTRLWLWAAGEGLRVLPGDPVDPVMEYVDLLACRVEVEGEDPPRGEYRIAGMSAGERERDRPGSGRFPVPGSGGRLGWVFDGHGLYAPDPAALVAEVRRPAGVA
jgi:hypothetical protein